MALSAMSGNGTTEGDDPLQTAVWRLRSRACWADAAALLRPDTAAPGPPADRPPRGAVSLHRAGLGGRRGRAADGRGAGPQRRRAGRGGLRARAPRLRGHAARGARPGRRGAGRARAGGGADPAGRCRAGAAGLPAGAARGEPGAFAAGRAGRVPAGPRGGRRPGRPAAAVVHLPSSGRTGPAGRGVDGGPARLRRIPADPGGVGLPRRYGTGAASLADAEAEPEASRLREEARRLFRLLGGVPTWLARQLAVPAPGAATA